MHSHLNVAQKICAYSGFTEPEVITTIQKYCRQYKRYEIPKASGGSRLILHPAKKLKILQYALLEAVLSEIPPSEIAAAYVRGNQSPLKNTALKHCSYKYTIRIDFKNFFPSLKPNDLLETLLTLYNLSDLDISIVSNLAFYRTKIDPIGFLPIGAPSSPAISNIIMRNLDVEIFNLSQAVDRESSISRYADDLHYSSNYAGSCAAFLSKLKLLIRITKSPSLSINDNKTLFLSRGTKRVITGLVITPDGRVTIGRSRKEQIKRLIYKFSQGKLTDKEIKSTKGYISFIRDCEPDFLDILAVKYGDNYFSLKGS